MGRRYKIYQHLISRSLKDNTIKEDIATLEKEEPGIQVIVSYNLGPALSNSCQ